MRGLKVRNIMTTVALVGLLSTSLPANVSFAEEGDAIKKADMQNLTSTALTEEVDVDDVYLNSENLLLIPGNFYSFFQKTMETVQLKLATTNEGRVLKLTEFATRKMEAALGLIQDEDFEAAAQLIEEALNYYEATLQNTEDFDQELTKKNDSTIDDQTTVEKTAELEEIPPLELEEETEEENSLHQSIVSLMRNIEKIKNPTANAALTRNVERKLEKLGLDRKVVFGSEEGEDLTDNQTEENEETVVDSNDESAIVEAKARGNGKEVAPGLNKEKRENKVKNGNGNNKAEKIKEKGNKKPNPANNGNRNNGNGNGNGKGNR